MLALQCPCDQLSSSTKEYLVCRNLYTCLFLHMLHTWKLWAFVSVWAITSVFPITLLYGGFSSEENLPCLLAMTEARGFFCHFPPRICSTDKESSCLPLISYYTRGLVFTLIFSLQLQFYSHGKGNSVYSLAFGKPLSEAFLQGQHTRATASLTHQELVMEPDV